MFTTDDLDVLADQVIVDWRAHADADWGVPAGTLEWSCRETAVHVVDTLFAPAFFLASRRTDAYPGFGPLSAPAKASITDLAHGLRGAANLLIGVVRDADPGVRAIIRRSPKPETAPPADFVPARRTRAHPPRPRHRGRARIRLRARIRAVRLSSWTTPAAGRERPRSPHRCRRTRGRSCSPAAGADQPGHHEADRGNEEGGGDGRGGGQRAEGDSTGDLTRGVALADEREDGRPGRRTRRGRSR